MLFEVVELSIRIRHSSIIWSNRLLHLGLIRFLQLVIGNTLDTRKERVIFVSNGDKEDKVRLSDEQKAAGVEIEQLIVDKLVEMHDKLLLDTNWQSSKNDIFRLEN